MSNPLLGRSTPDYVGFTPPGYAPHQAGTGVDRPINLDDVLMRTATLFAVVLGFAVTTWTLAAAVPAVGAVAWMVGLGGSLALGLYLALRRAPAGPVLALCYAAFEGIFVGAVSQPLHALTSPPGTNLFDSVVTQALLGTVCVFAAMLGLYKTGLVKVTAKFRSVVTLMVLGYLLFALVNLGYAVITDTPFGVGGTGALGIGISLFAVGLASVTLLLDFDSIESAIATATSARYGWQLAVGLVTGIVWLYLELLRLLARLAWENIAE